MFSLLVRLMLIAALAEFGMNTFDLSSCHSRQCIKILQVKALDVLKIEWRPINIFP